MKQTNIVPDAEVQAVTTALIDETVLSAPKLWSSLEKEVVCLPLSSTKKNQVAHIRNSSTEHYMQTSAIASTSQRHKSAK